MSKHNFILKPYCWQFGMVAVMYCVFGIASAQSDTDTTLTPLPELRSDRETTEPLPEGEPFFDAQFNYDRLQSQIDSLKQVIKIYQQRQSLPPVNPNLPQLLDIPAYQHRITLKNGTVVSGTILQETDDGYILQTQIGRLVLKRDMVMEIDEAEPLQPKLELDGQPSVDIYPEYELIKGTVKNSGEIRADFVRVIANLWSRTTELAAQDSAFISGTEYKYETGVSTDTALEPGAEASFRIRIDHNNPDNVEYRTFDIHWMMAP